MTSRLNDICAQWPLHQMDVKHKLSPDTDFSIDKDWKHNACFAVYVNTKFKNTYLLYDERGRLCTHADEIIIPFYEGIHSVFPHAYHKEGHWGCFYLDGVNYDWHPSEFIYCVSLLRYPIEMPWMMFSYKKFLDWGATPSQALVAAQYWIPDEHRGLKFTLMGNWNIQIKAYGGHAVTVPHGRPKSLYEYSIPKITTDLRSSNSTRMSSGRNGWQGGAAYISGPCKLEPVDNTNNVLTRQAFERLISNPKEEKSKDASYYTL